MEMNFDAIKKLYDFDSDGQLSGCNNIDDCFKEAYCIGTSKYPEEVKECEFESGEDIAVNVYILIMCGRLAEKYFKENKFTNDPKLNEEIITKVQEFFNMNKGE